VGKDEGLRESGSRGAPEDEKKGGGEQKRPQPKRGPLRKRGGQPKRCARGSENSPLTRAVEPKKKGPLQTEGTRLHRKKREQNWWGSVMRGVFCRDANAAPRDNKRKKSGREKGACQGTMERKGHSTQEAQLGAWGGKAVRGDSGAGRKQKALKKQQQRRRLKIKMCFPQEKSLQSKAKEKKRERGEKCLVTANRKKTHGGFGGMFGEDTGNVWKKKSITLKETTPI